jgi:hypothetical protein
MLTSYFICRQFIVVWGKQSKKKHKTWEGDGILEVGEKTVILKVFLILLEMCSFLYVSVICRRTGQKHLCCGI